MLLLACRGRPVRPPIVKVMLQTSAATPDEAQKTLQSLAGEVYAWTKGNSGERKKSRSNPRSSRFRCQEEKN